MRRVPITREASCDASGQRVHGRAPRDWTERKTIKRATNSQVGVNEQGERPVARRPPRRVEGDK